MDELVYGYPPFHQERERGGEGKERIGERNWWWLVKIRRGHIWAIYNIELEIVGGGF